MRRIVDRTVNQSTPPTRYEVQMASKEPYHDDVNDTFRDGQGITNTPSLKSKYAHLFWMRTCMLVLTWAITSTSIGLGFWASNVSVHNRNTLLTAFNPPAVVWVNVNNIYTSATITVVGFCVLWIVLVFAIAVNFVFAKRPYKFRGFACTIIALCIWTLIAGAAETWFFARSGTQLIVTIDGVRISQADVNAILLAAGIPLRYRSSLHWRVVIAFIWINFFTGVATATVLFAADSQAAHAARIQGSSMASGTTAYTDKSGTADNVKARGSSVELAGRSSLERPPPRSPLRERGDKGGRDGDIEEVPRPDAVRRSFSEGGEGDRLVDVNLDAPTPGVAMKPLHLGLRGTS
ncbi:hypothetical protein HYPSUDRAFT_208442 [Hypholoma sublateritium FD-334 SS-4]|uniref:Uncharacterized protein n=1 Tax=Hypholoma sublateritium (strain FD-334 SS-4) TaxID=945553 RepID=A0A0D2KJF6_HYPSF|nr:hypothetical protein HYPSUDRAFT_208442 [Hypholoma sublateritium FD-334 SS-4]